MNQIFKPDDVVQYKANGLHEALVIKYSVKHKMYQLELNLMNVSQNDNVRVFGFNGKEDKDKDQSVVLIAINYDMNNAAKIMVNINGMDGSKYNCQGYYITPADNNDNIDSGNDSSNIKTRLIYVNQVLMAYKDGKFPNIEPVSVSNGYIELDPARLGFFVFVQT